MSNTEVSAILDALRGPEGCWEADVTMTYSPSQTVTGVVQLRDGVWSDAGSLFPAPAFMAVGAGPLPWSPGEAYHKAMDPLYATLGALVALPRGAEVVEIAAATPEGGSLRVQIGRRAGDTLDLTWSESFLPEWFGVRSIPARPRTLTVVSGRRRARVPGLEWTHALVLDELGFPVAVTRSMDGRVVETDTLSARRPCGPPLAHPPPRARALPRDPAGVLGLLRLGGTCFATTLPQTPVGRATTQVRDGVWGDLIFADPAVGGVPPLVVGALPEWTRSPTAAGPDWLTLAALTGELRVSWSDRVDGGLTVAISGPGRSFEVDFDPAGYPREQRTLGEAPNTLPMTAPGVCRPSVTDHGAAPNPTWPLVRW